LHKNLSQFSFLLALCMHLLCKDSYAGPWPSKPINEDLRSANTSSQYKNLERSTAVHDKDLSHCCAKTGYHIVRLKPFWYFLQIGASAAAATTGWMGSHDPDKCPPYISAIFGSISFVFQGLLKISDHYDKENKEETRL